MCVSASQNSWSSVVSLNTQLGLQRRADQSATQIRGFIVGLLNNDAQCIDHLFSFAWYNDVDKIKNFLSRMNRVSIHGRYCTSTILVPSIEQVNFKVPVRPYPELESSITSLFSLPIIHCKSWQRTVSIPWRYDARAEAVGDSRRPFEVPDKSSSGPM